MIKTASNSAYFSNAFLNTANSYCSQILTARLLADWENILVQPARGFFGLHSKSVGYCLSRIGGFCRGSRNTQSLFHFSFPSSLKYSATKRFLDLLWPQLGNVKFFENVFNLLNLYNFKYQQTNYKRINFPINFLKLATFWDFWNRSISDHNFFRYCGPSSFNIIDECFLIYFYQQPPSVNLFLFSETMHSYYFKFRKSFISLLMDKSHRLNVGLISREKTHKFLS